MKLKIGRGFLLACAFASALTACTATDPLNPRARDEASLIIFYSDTSRISAPDTVNRGTEFEISFQTFAGGCTRAIARTDTAISNNVIRIAAFDRSSGDAACTRDLLLLRHAVRVRLNVQGPATIRVVGEQRGGSTGAVNGPAELSRQLIVR